MPKGNSDQMVPAQVESSQYLGRVSAPLAPAGMLSVEAAREVQEMQAAYLSARYFPRDYVAATNRVIQSCKRLSMASVALYAYPRGKTVVTGPSIRMAEMLVSAWGNVRCGIKEIERRKDESIARAFAVDLESNSSWEITFTVPHVRYTRDGSYDLTDPRDIYEVVANAGSRRVRACILRVIPREVVDAGLEEVKRTLKAGGGKTVQERLVDMVGKFLGVGVPQDAIEARLGHAIDATTEDEIVDLQAIYTTVRDHPKKRFDFFSTLKAPTSADDVTKKIKGGKSEAPIAAPAAAASKPEAREDDEDWPEGE